MLINLLSEYIVGSHFEDISPQIFKVLSDFCTEVILGQKVSIGVDKDKMTIIKNLPTLTEQYQQLLKQQLAFSGLQKEFQAIKKKLDITKFADNDFTANQDLFSSRMFAKGNHGDQSKVQAEFSDVKYLFFTRVYHIELSSLHEEYLKHFENMEKIKGAQDTICEYELKSGDLEDLLKFVEQITELQNNLKYL